MIAPCCVCFVFFFFFQAEDGIRDIGVTGVQTCALPIFYDNLTKYIRFVLILLVVFVLTFLGASLFDIADGEPFNPAQVLWIHFFVNAALGFALGFDAESPGLMSVRPRPRGEPVLTRAMALIVGPVGVVITACLLGLIQLGAEHYGSLEVGISIAFTAFALCLIVAALECRSETGTVFTTVTFESKVMNRAVFGEFALAVLVVQTDVFNRLLDTTPLTGAQFLWALLPAVVLLLLWEAGKAVARRSRAVHHASLISGNGTTVRTAADRR